MQSNDIDFLIIDGDSFIHRAYHGYKAYNKSNNSNEDEEVFAIKGFTEMISRVLNKYKYKYLAVVLDDQGDSFRKEIYPEYKINRPPKPESFLSQIEDIHKYIKSSGLPYFCIENVEGDDVIGVLAEKAKNFKWKTKILSGDKDMAQVIDENTVIFDTKSQKEINLENIEANFGVRDPKQIIDLLALKGDIADNIKGLEGCGDKTAIKIIEHFKSINNLINYENKNERNQIIEKLTRNKIKSKIIIEQLDNKPNELLLSKFLTSLKLDIEMNLKIGDIKSSIHNIDFNELNRISLKYKLDLNKSLPQEIKNNIKLL